MGVNKYFKRLRRWGDRELNTEDRIYLEKIIDSRKSNFIFVLALMMVLFSLAVVVEILTVASLVASGAGFAKILAFVSASLTMDTIFIAVATLVVRFELKECETEMLRYLYQKSVQK